VKALKKKCVERKSRIGLGGKKIKWGFIGMKKGDSAGGSGRAGNFMLKKRSPINHKKERKGIEEGAGPAWKLNQEARPQKKREAKGAARQKGENSNKKKKDHFWLQVFRCSKEGGVTQ